MNATKLKPTGFPSIGKLNITSHTPNSFKVNNK